MDIDVLFLGAGASTPFGIPTMKGMVSEFEGTLEPGPSKQLYDLITDKLANYKYFDLESLITVLQDIVEPSRVVGDILNDPSIHFYVDSVSVGWDQACQWVDHLAESNRGVAGSLLTQLKEYLRRTCSVELREDELLLYNRLLDTILSGRVPNFMEHLQERGPKNVQLSVFTTNYDLILESYCTDRELTYSNGERDKYVMIRSDEGGQLLGFPGGDTIRIRKLHGSINWYRDQKGRLRYSDTPVTVGKKSVYGDEIVEEVLLYPVRGLYAYREPFYDLFCDLKRALEIAKNCLVIGYSFRDKDIAGLFIDAAKKNHHLTLCLAGLGDDTMRTVVHEHLAGFNGRLTGTSAKFNHENIDELIGFLQNPADSEVVTKSLYRITKG